MIDRVRPQWYLEEGFRLLRMVKVSPERVTLLRLSLAEMPKDILSTPGLLTEPSLERQEALCRDMAGRLKSRCLGLLEAPCDETDPTSQTVSFIHKSVFDFIETDTAQSRIMACPGQDTFHPEVALLRASILELKTLPDRGRRHFSRMDWFDWLKPAICDRIKLALVAEKASRLPNVGLLKELGATADAIWGSVQPKSYAEEDGTVHWISAYRLGEPTEVCEWTEERILDLADRDYLEGPPDHREVWAMNSFDELCQEAGLDLYTAAIGGRLRAPAFRSLRGQLRDDHPRNGVSESLMAAEELSTGNSQARLLEPQHPRVTGDVMDVGRAMWQGKL
jgi:hypothetical protein